MRAGPSRIFGEARRKRGSRRTPLGSVVGGGWWRPLRVVVSWVRPQAKYKLLGGSDLHLTPNRYRTDRIESEIELCPELEQT